MSKTQINLLANQFVSLKSGIDELQIKLLEKQKKLAEVEQKIIAYLNKSGRDTVTTEVGSIRKQISQEFEVSQWDELYRFIVYHNRPQFLKQQICHEAVSQYLKINPVDFAYPHCLISKEVENIVIQAEKTKKQPANSAGLVLQQK